VDWRRNLNAALCGQGASKAQHLGAIRLHRKIFDRAPVETGFYLEPPTECCGYRAAICAYFTSRWAESNQFDVLSLQKHIDDFDMQISAFVRNSVLSFRPDVIPFSRKSDLAEGVQADASWRINDSHTLRGGFLGQVETTTFDTTSSVASCVPIN
jgi:hypothetical protein